MGGVFISCSAKDAISYDVALLLREWLPNVIQTVKPFLSAVDIDAGSQWAAEMFQALKDTQVGIICVTRKSQAAPWINFEAGALAKAMESSRVCPLLIDVKSADVTGPLTTFQMQPLDREGLFNVLKVLNQHCGGEPLSIDVLRKALDKWWSEFETRLSKILSVQRPSNIRRDSTEMLEEVLNLVRSIDKAVTPNVSPLRWSKDPAALIAYNLRDGLSHKVGESRPEVADFLRQCLPGMDDGVLILKVPSHLEQKLQLLTMPIHKDFLWEVVSQQGLRVKIEWGEKCVEIGF